MATEHKVSASGRTTTVVSTLMAILAVIAVALRFWSRKMSRAGYGADDWWILVGMLLMVVVGGILVSGAQQHLLYGPLEFPMNLTARCQ